MNKVGERNSSSINYRGKKKENELFTSLKRDKSVAFEGVGGGSLSLLPSKSRAAIMIPIGEFGSVPNLEFNSSAIFTS